MNSLSQGASIVANTNRLCVALNVGSSRQSPTTSSSVSPFSRQPEGHSEELALQNRRQPIESAVSRRDDRNHNEAIRKETDSDPQALIIVSKDTKSQENACSSCENCHVFGDTNLQGYAVQHNGNVGHLQGHGSNKHHFGKMSASDQSRQFNGNCNEAALKIFLETRIGGVSKK